MTMAAEGMALRAVTELMASARSYFIPASGRWLVEIPAFSFVLWAVSQSEKEGRIKLAARVARWLRKEAD